MALILRVPSRAVGDAFELFATGSIPLTVFFLRTPAIQASCCFSTGCSIAPRAHHSQIQVGQHSRLLRSYWQTCRSARRPSPILQRGTSAMGRRRLERSCGAPRHLACYQNAGLLRALCRQKPRSVVPVARRDGELSTALLYHLEGAASRLEEGPRADGQLECATRRTIKTSSTPLPS